MATVAFFSNEKELEILQKREDSDVLRLIALTPEADVAMEKAFLRRNTIEDYYSEEELNVLGNNSLENVQRLCDFIDESYIPIYSKFSCSDIYMYMKLLYDQILINHTFCSGVLKKDQPKKVIFFNLGPLSSEIIVKSNDDFLANFLYYFFRVEKKISCEVLCSNTDFVSTKKFQIFSVVPFIKKKISNFKFRLENQFYRFINFNKSSIFVLQHYDFSVCKWLRSQSKLYWKNKNRLSLSDYKEKQQFTIKYYNLDNYISFDGISYSLFVSPKINFLIEDLPLIFSNIAMQYENFYHNKKIKAIISASGQSLDVLAGIKAAKICNIPLIWGQHGGLYGYGEFPISKYIDISYTHFFVYTDAVGVINHDKNCFAVSDSKLLNLYREKREKVAH